MKCFYYAFFFFVLPFKVNADNELLLGLIGSDFFIVNHQNPSISFFFSTDIPNGVVVRDLSYSTMDCVFYGLIDGSSAPRLVSIDWNGLYTDIGLLNLPNETVYLAEAMAYNKIDNKLYASVSLNGGIPDNDYSSETIVEVNPTNAAISIVSLLNAGSTTDTDIDVIGFMGDLAIISDGEPGGATTTGIYEIDFATLGASVSPSLLYFGDYYGLGQFANCGTTFYATNNQYALYAFETTDNSFNYIGQTHSADDYDGALMTGLQFIEKTLIPSLDIDTTVCENESVVLTVEQPNDGVIWSTGFEGNSITVNEPGAYWASIIFNGCFATTDTAFVSHEVCHPCDQYYTEIAENLIFPPDQTLCLETGDSLFLTIGIDTATVIWNNGLAFGDFWVTQSGDYWAEVILDTCTYTTDTITIDYEICDACQYTFQQIESNLILPPDQILCLETGDSLFLTVGIDTATVIWNNGLAFGDFWVTQPGNYWAEVILDTCTYTTDTITIEYEICDGCQYTFQQIESNLILPPDQTLCLETGDSLFLTIGIDTATVIWNNGLVFGDFWVTQPGDYWAEVILDTCTYTTDTITINYETCDSCQYYFSLIENELMIGDNFELCESDSIILSLDIDEAFSIVWNNGVEGNEIVIYEAGEYWANIMIDDCIYQTEVFYVSVKDCLCTYLIPNAFSPNNDGFNDYFRPIFTSNCTATNIELLIFNRWGNLVEKNNFAIWDGTKDGVSCEIGVYLYVITMDFESGQSVLEHGNVTIIR